MNKISASIRLWLLLAVATLCGSVNADNQYGLKDNIQDGVILHCFDWTLTDITAEIPNIAAAGFSAVQTSPIHQKEGFGSPWYMAYQPYDYVIGNGLGTESDLRDLCNTAHQYGVKVIVDVVANHTNGNLQYVADYWKNTDLYHGNNAVTDWNDRYQVTHGSIGMWDLKTEDSRVQTKIHEYIESLKNAGVDGIRWDAAKHIGLPSEGDSFWQNVPDKAMYNYGEILDGTGGDDSKLLPEYQQYISITDNTYGNSLAQSFNSNQVPSSIGAFNQNGAATEKLVYWGESHDTYSNNSGYLSKNMSQNVIDRAYAIAAGNYGATALYFSRPSSTDKEFIKMGQKGSTHFTSKEVAEVNKMHNICAGESNYYVHENNVAAQVRKSGAVIVLGNGSNQDVSFANADGKGTLGMTAGTYTDKVSGGTFTVTTSTISGHVGDKGIAVIYDGNKQPNPDPDPDPTTEGYVITKTDGTTTTLNYNDYDYLEAFRTSEAEDAQTGIRAYKNGAVAKTFTQSEFEKLTFSASGNNGGDNGGGDNGGGNNGGGTSEVSQPDYGQYYGTNPSNHVGKYKTITAATDWTADMIVAQGGANDDPRAFRGYHEKATDLYALYAAWDETNLYVAVEMPILDDRNTKESDFDYFGDQFLPMGIGINTGKLTAGNGIMDDGNTTVWGNGTVWYSIDEGIDHLLYFHPREGVTDGAIFTAQNGKFSYTNGFKKMTDAGIQRHEYWGTAVSSGFYGESDNYGKSMETYVSEAKSGTGFSSLTTKGSLYQVTIPLTELGIDKSYIESHGIKLMAFSTFGTSMMDALPWCSNLIDKASDAYSQDDSTSAEKEDTDDYNVPLACVGKVWSTK